MADTDQPQPILVNSSLVKVSLPRQTMLCGAVIGRMKPKLTTKPSSMAMVMALMSPSSRCSTAIMIGSSAEFSEVALA